MNELLVLLLAFPLAIVANILLGMALGSLEYEFDAEIAKRGFIKGLYTYGGIAFLVGISYLLPEYVFSFSINDVAFTGTVMQLMVIAMAGGTGYYGIQALTKLFSITKIKAHDVYKQVERIETEGEG